MCGFVIIGNYSPTAISIFQRDAFQNALVADSARGMDGTGVLRVMREGDAQWVKAAGNPFDLFRTNNFVDKFWGPVNSGYTRWLIGHNRYKTKGEASNKNSHPFQHGNIILAHNGTMRGGNIPEIGKYTVDSEAICASVAERGIEETLQRIDSAYCFVYYDTKEKTLNIIRNKERPMHMGINLKEHLIALASEPELMDWALMRNSQYIESYIELKEHVLYTWTLDKIVPTERVLKGWHTKKNKKGKKRSMWINGEEWVDIGDGVYSKVDQIKDTKPTDVERRSENNYATATNNWFTGKHSAMCCCQACLKGMSTSTTADKETATVLKLPAPAKMANGTVFSVDSYLGLKKGGTYSFNVDDYEEITKSSDDSSTEKAYLVIGYSTVFKDFIFKTRIKGEDSLKSVLDADFVEGRVVSLLINKDPGASIGTVYLSFPMPGWDMKGPAQIPEHAYEDGAGEAEHLRTIYSGE